MKRSVYLDKNAILNALTKEDIIKVVTSLGSDYPKTDGQGNLIFKSICHGSDSHKLYYYPTKEVGKEGRFFCFSGCGDSLSLIELVIRTNRTQGKTVTFYKALHFIAYTTGKVVEADSIKNESSNLINDFDWINKLKATRKKQREVPTLSEINENILEMFYYAPHEDWLNDNISREALSRYEIGYYGLTNQITIPHRDKEGRLIGIRGRNLSEDDVEQIGKYLPLQIEGRFLNHSLGSNFFGINVTSDKIKKIKKVMLVESEKSCLQNYSYFGEDSFALATCGSNLTLTQQKLLLQYFKCEEVILAFDREYKGRGNSFEAELYFNKLVKKVANLVPYCKVSFLLDSEDKLPYKASPTDMGKDVLLELLEDKIVVTMDDVDRLKNK